MNTNWTCYPTKTYIPLNEIDEVKNRGPLDEILVEVSISLDKGNVVASTVLWGCTTSLSYRIAIKYIWLWKLLV